MSAPPLLEVRDLVKRFSRRRSALGGESGEVSAVDGVSFRLEAGRTLGLVGESGSGKSTTARAVLRLVEPDGGTVLFRGEDVRAYDRRRLRRFRRRAQIVFQDPFGSLNPRMSASAALHEALAVHAVVEGRVERRRRVGELLERVGLSSQHGFRRPHELSGGQRQRVAIARALSVEPELLVLDEPVSSLDVSVQAQVLALLRRLQDDLGLTYLFISHDLAVVAGLCHRMAVMHRGRIVEEGPTRELCRQPRDAYTRTLLEAVPRLRTAGPQGRREP